MCLGKYSSVEVKWTIRTLKDGKGLGCDNMMAEMVKISAEKQKCNVTLLLLSLLLTLLLLL